MSSSDTDESLALAELREDSREYFDKLIDLLTEEFEVKISEAECTPQDVKNYEGLTGREKLKVTGQSLMVGIACICKIELIRWVKDVLEMQNPDHRFRILVQKREADPDE